MFLNIFPYVAVRPILLCLSQTFMQSRKQLQKTWERSKGAAVTPALFPLPLPHCVRTRKLGAGFRFSRRLSQPVIMLTAPRKLYFGSN